MEIKRMSRMGNGMVSGADASNLAMGWRKELT